MSDIPYRPISCDEHDRLEAAAVEKREVEIEFEQKGVRQRERGRIDDIFSTEGEEFLRFRADNGTVEIRLDRIRDVREIGG